MASECAILGTPAIYVNTLTAGTLSAQEKAGCITIFRDFEGVLAQALDLLSNEGTAEDAKEKTKALLAGTVDVTEFMIQAVADFPESLRVLRTSQSDII